MKTAILWISLLIITLPLVSLYAEWNEEGLRVTPLLNARDEYFNACPDSMGGLYIGWMAYDDPGYTGSQLNRVQHVDSDGNLLWGDGIHVAHPDSFYRQDFGHCITAPDGGVYVGFQARIEEDDPPSIWVQRLSPEGERLWGPRGVRVSYEDGYHQLFPEIRFVTVPDGEGGIIQGMTSTYYIDDVFYDHISAARVSPEGEVLWSNAMVSPSMIDAFPTWVQAFAYPGNGALFFTLDNDILVARHVDLDGEVHWSDMPEVMPTDIYDEDEEVWLGAETFEAAPLPNGETAVAIGAVDLLFYVRLGADGSVLNSIGGRLISNENNIQPAFGPVVGANASISADSTNVYISLFTFARNYYYYIDFDGNLLNDSPQRIGNYSLCENVSLFSHTDYQVVFFSFSYQYAGTPSAQLIGHEGWLPWGLDVHYLVPLPPYHPTSTLSYCEIAPDTFAVTWFSFDTFHGRATRALYTLRVPLREYLDVPESTENPAILPDEIEIQGTYPNPFNSSIAVRFSAPTPGDYRIEVFNLLGQTVHAESLTVPTAGIIPWRWFANTCPSSTYILRIANLASSQKVNKRIVLLR